MHCQDKAMIVISHRGNLKGRNLKKENNPDHIREVLNTGIDVEVDVWWSAKGWFLGHDFPQYRVTMDFLGTPGLWCHAKNHAALDRMVENPLIHCFWHQRDDYTLTSKGYIWAYPQKKRVITRWRFVSSEAPGKLKKLLGFALTTLFGGNRD